MQKYTLIAAASVLALSGAGIALAQHHGGHGGHRGPSMERADADGDGIITLDEAKTHGAERFAKMDANEDGSINREDREARAEIRFAETDANGDGEVTPDEMTAAREKREAEMAKRRAERQAMMFERLDTDGSGGLSQAELEAGKALRAEARGDRRGQHMGRRGGGAGPMRMLRRADTNNDQAISREEFDAMIEARFAKLDTDGSGAITEAEREAAKANRKGRHGRRGEREGVGAGS
ncbi:MAG: hypothetical protein AAFR64_07915 [Pseudomonadota bacterium]